MTVRRLLAGLLPTTLLLVALPAPANAAPNLYPSGVGVDLGPTPTTLGVKPAAGEDPAGLQTGTEQGKTYWRTNRAANTEFLSFDVDRDYVEALSTNDVVVTVTYLDAGSGVLKLQYDAEADPAANATAIPLTNEGGWKTGTFDLADIEFADRLGGADLRLTGDADITIAALRISTVGASVQLGANPQQDGVSVRAGDRGEGLITGAEQGRTFWQTNLAAPPPGTGFFYLNVSDTFLYDNRNLVLISIDYFDEGNGRLGLHYDSPGDELIDKFKPSAVFQYGDTKTWKTHTFALDDAVMTNRSNGSDLRIHVGDGTVDLKVAAVRIAKVATTLNLTEGLQNLITEAARVEKAAREGTRDGQFPVGSRATLRQAIDKARAVAAKPGVTDTEVKAALYELDGKLAAFRASAVDTNIAPSGTASASSGGGPAQVIDGNPATVWTSDAGTTGEWLQVDLGTTRAINDVRVNWAGAYSPDYAVALSTDGASFTPAGRIGSPGGNQTSRTRFATTTARYVRVMLDNYAPGGSTFAVKELQVRNVPVPTPQSKLVQTVNPTEDGVIADFDITKYGVDRTGRADATKAIQRALYDCQDAGGGTVWLPVGKYRVTDTLEVHAFCTLRGDRRDPDVAHGNYGTLVVADLPTGGDAPLFRIGGSAGVMGLTTYYPRQNATSPVPYGYTFEVPGNAWIGNENYMMSTVSDVTMLNSYKGIGISTFANDRGGSPGSSQVHESTTIRNVKGTVLFEGTRAYNGADVGTWENVTFSNAYWAAVPGAPTRAAIDTWTRANGTGFVLGDLEWDQFHRISASDYKVGIRVVAGQRASFTGSFLQPEIRRTTTALLVDEMDERWGMTLAGGRLEGKIQNDSRGYVKITGTDVEGETSGTVYRMAGAAPTYTPGPLPSPARRVLYSASAAPHGVGYLPSADATGAIQKVLDKAAREGGGIVYLPAGWYRISTRLRVPAGVELRGASAVPNRDQSGTSGGTVLHAFEGRNAPATAPALITLDGNRAGVRGLRAFYPENNPGKAEGLVPYPYTVRANGTSTYVVNVGLPNAWNGLDFATYRNDGFVVRKLAGAFFDNTIAVGNSKNGRIEGMLSNGNAVTRVGYQVPHWMTEGDIFALVIDKYMRKQAKLVTVDGATNLKIFNIFGYGFHDGLKVTSGEVDVFNIGTDNLGSDGFTIAVAGGDVDVTNVARYNGSTSTGPVKLRNVMAINIVERAISAKAEAGGTVVLQGNESAPGRYEPGVTVTASAKASAGYAFRDWTVDGTVVSTSADYTFTVGSTDLVVTANFTTN
ncbi:discoidin domain-containing protein [Kribbella sp. NBC_01245]|uniref:discoidin domain-containing protein n=1 Tax=Kribbella sp. NBC_01245 TaxID=2903578 RepID=UPI002E2E8010|nr:glycosyl hydrolase family 28-related protein [Kribbella sp. NBC_01245]